MSAAPAPARITRRGFLTGAGALVVGFALQPRLTAGQGDGAADAKAPAQSESFKKSPLLESWIRVDADGRITVFTGKVEFGQGIKTALTQIAAEELVIEPQRINLITADTQLTPDEGYTAGSQSMQHSGSAIRQAAAQVRAILVGLAAARFNAAADTLTVQNGTVRAADGRTLSYGELASTQTLHVAAQPEPVLKDPATYTIVGKSMPRVDIPAKLTGAAIYVQDHRLPGMLHARVVYPPSYGARLRELNSAHVEAMPGFIKIVRDGDFIAVVAEHEFQAIVAARALAKAANWDERRTLPAQDRLYAHIRALPSRNVVIAGGSAVPSSGAGVIAADFHRPYQMHASIGPSCAVGLMQDETLTIWTHSQGVYPLRKAISEMLRRPEERVRCIQMEGSGCYGHNGADDAAADAALIASALPGRPVRVHWMREQEHAWEPYGSAMVASARAQLDAVGNIATWQYEVWSCTHSTRPGRAGNLAPATLLRTPFTPPQPEVMPQPNGGGDRNAIPYYKFRNVRVVNHFIPAMPLRVSALRSLGAYMNVFSIESFMDELAKAAGADPVEFRLRHLEDPRAREVVLTAAERFGWSAYRPQRGRGRGFAFARYKNLAAYTAIACEVEVERETGRIQVLRAVAAVDSGEAVNPDGITNQIEGGIIQSLSWTLFESVTFNDTRITSTDWSTYPILRFSHLPDSVNVHVINRPGQPFLGTGEAAQGPTAAALANAVADAMGVRIRALPLTWQRVKAAIGI